MLARVSNQDDAVTRLDDVLGVHEKLLILALSRASLRAMTAGGSVATTTKVFRLPEEGASSVTGAFPAGCR